MSTLEMWLQDAGFLTKPAGEIIYFASYQGNIRGQAGWRNDEEVYLNYTDPFFREERLVLPYREVQGRLEDLHKFCTFGERR